MKHEITFDGGRVLFDLMPTSVVFEMQDIAGGKADTSDVDGEATRQLMKLLDGYCDTIDVDGVDETFPCFTDCPLPWGMMAFEAVLDFSFPTQNATKSSAKSPSTPKARAASPAIIESSSPSVTC